MRGGTRRGGRPRRRDTKQRKHVKHQVSRQARSNHRTGAGLASGSKV